MGLLIDGVWRDQWYDTKATGGAFVRSNASFRNWITADGRPGQSGAGGYVAESGAIICMFRWPVRGRIALIFS